MTESTFIRTVQRNCDISDARDNGIYSICTLVLKLRNLYKWEHGLEPWQEPASAELLEWIEARENFWKTIADKPFEPLPVNGLRINPWDADAVNTMLTDSGLVYGAGYGRSMKAVFFVAELLRQETVEGCPVLVLGREKATELASPFAMLQDGVITIRRSPLRLFFWDHIQDIRASSRISLLHALERYGVLADGTLSQQAARQKLDAIVDGEIPMFIYHEVGEMLESTLDSDTLKTMIGSFPDSAIEFVGRAIKDILADTHPRGMISFIIREQREASLGFYAGFLDGVRKVLFPEMPAAFQQFLRDRDWQGIERARCRCRDHNLLLAGKIKEITRRIDHEPLADIKQRFNGEILAPLGLDIPEQQS
jgi:hypothetical protein